MTQNPITRTGELREARGWTQLELAARSGLSIGSVHRLEHAADRAEADTFTVHSLRRVAMALGVSLVYLYPCLGEKPPKEKQWEPNGEISQQG